SNPMETITPNRTPIHVLHSCGQIKTTNNLDHNHKHQSRKLKKNQCFK
ncbi:hypothetical protein SLEP1_g42728, partial [Rubroshorea leprosula]